MAVCESCGRSESETTKVQRMYLVAGDEGDGELHPIDPGETPTAGEIENWCATCCASFPHVVVQAE